MSCKVLTSVSHQCSSSEPLTTHESWNPRVVVYTLLTHMEVRRFLLLTDWQLCKVSAVSSPPPLDLCVHQLGFSWTCIQWIGRALNKRSWCSTPGLAGWLSCAAVQRWRLLLWGGDLWPLIPVALWQSKQTSCCAFVSPLRSGPKALTSRNQRQLDGWWDGLKKVRRGFSAHGFIMALLFCFVTSFIRGS